MSRWVVVLAGGMGTRFWPLSTRERPKQLLPLAGDDPMIVETIRRVRPVAQHVLVLTSASLRAAIARLLPELPSDHILVEPAPAGTAAALTWAASEIERREGPDATMISVHADWTISDEPAFQRALLEAASVAESKHALVTVGIVPSRPDPGFGYVVPSGTDGARPVERFVEKPSREVAASLIKKGALWNSGIFAWRVGDFLGEVRRHTTEVAPALAAAKGDATRFFSAVKPISVDHGVLERSDRVMVIAGQFGWDDVGTWSALRRVRRRDAEGNATHGRVIVRESRDNILHAEGGTVVVYGVDGLVVVTRPGVTLVTTVERATDLKSLVESLPSELKE